MEQIDHFNRQPQLLDGKLTHSLIRFALPFLLSNILQTLYGTVDLIIIGHFSDSASALAAVSNASQIIHVITLFITGFASGGMVLIGQYLGARQYDRIQDAISTIFCFFFLLGAAISLLTIFMCSWLLRIMNVPVESVPAAHSYLTICGGGLLITTGYNVCSAVLRGLGDSKGPLLFISIACVSNLIGDLIFVGFFHMGPAGAAYATVLAQSISVLFAAQKLKTIHHQSVLEQRRLKINPVILAKLIHLGLPIASEGLFVSISFMLITAMINRFGIIAASASGIVEKIASISRLPANSFSAAVSAMVAQSIGANHLRRAKQIMYAGILSSVCLSILTFSAMRFASSTVMQLYTSDTDIIFAGCEYIHFYSYDTLLVCITFCMAGFFSGSGNSLFTLIRNLASTLLVRVPLAYYFCHMASVRMSYIGLAAPIASVASILISLFYLRFGPVHPAKHNKTDRS